MHSDDKHSSITHEQNTPSLDLVDNSLEKQSLLSVIANLNNIINTLNTTIQDLTKKEADLTKRDAAQSALIAVQTEKISKLTELVTVLIEQNKKKKSTKSNDSSNSSLPPSASNPSKSTGNLSTKKVNRDQSLRKKTQEKSGRLLGHEGSGMKLKEDSDRIVDIFPKKCLGCKHIGSCILDGRVCDRRYTKDIQMSVVQTEYRNWEFQCPNSANETVQGTFPKDVTGSKQYGQSIKTVVVMLRNMGIISFDRIVHICSSLGFQFSTGTIHSICKKFASKCKDVRSLITSLLLSSPVLGVDETGGNINGNKVWHHATVSEQATLITAHQNRGLEGTLDAGVMQNFKGVLVHDFWKSYFMIPEVSHAMCAAHLERENNRALDDNPHLTWPAMMNDLFHELERMRKDYRQNNYNRIPKKVLLPYLDCYDDIIEKGFAEDPIPLIGTKLK
jgi:transposase